MGTIPKGGKQKCFQGIRAEVVVLFDGVDERIEVLCCMGMGACDCA